MKIKILTIWAVFLLSSIGLIWGAPVNPNVTYTLQIDDKDIEVRQWGDEFACGYETLDGYTIIKKDDVWFYAKRDENGMLLPSNFAVGVDNPAESGINKYIRPSLDYIKKMREKIRGKDGMFSQTKDARFEGDWNVLTILMEFPDQLHTYSMEEMHELVYSINPEEPRSFADYYREVSNGKFRIFGDTTGWYMTENNRSYYGANSAGWDANLDEFIEEAIKAADPDVDFSKYDNDSDGFVDAVNFFHAGMGEQFGGDSNDLMTHMGRQYMETDDGVDIIKYTMDSELLFRDMAPVGVLCHEYGHTLDLPDLYDYDYSSSGIGDYGLMGYGLYNSAYGKMGDCPAHLSPWSKKELAWLEPIEIQLPGNYALSSVYDSFDCFMIRGKLPVSEYFLVEYREREGFDAGLPGREGGILVWHIDVRAPNNDNENRKMVDLEQAQPYQSIDYSYDNHGDHEDYFRAGKEFTEKTDPNSNPNADSLIGSGISLVNFEKSIEERKYLLYAALREYVEAPIEFALHAEPMMEIYQNSDRIVIATDLYTVREPLSADVYFVMLDQTMGKIFYGMNWDSRTTPLIGNIMLPADLSVYNIKLLEIEIPSAKPPLSDPGIYTFAIGAFAPGTSEQISNISRVDVEIE